MKCFQYYSMLLKTYNQTRGKANVLHTWNKQYNLKLNKALHLTYKFTLQNNERQVLTYKICKFDWRISPLRIVCSMLVNLKSELCYLKRENCVKRFILETGLKLKNCVTTKFFKNIALEMFDYFYQKQYHSSCFWGVSTTRRN